MKHEEFEALAARLDKYATRHPKRYRLRVFLLAIAGYLLPAAVMTGALLICFGGFFVLIDGPSLTGALLLWTVTPLVLFFSLAEAFLVLRPLWIKIEAPEGYVLTRHEAEPLFDIVDDIRSQLATPPVHSIYLTGDNNAGMLQRPRLGLFGWHRNELVIGLPLLHCLSSRETRSVIAHELAHLSQEDSKFNGWIIRTRASWSHFAKLVSTDQQSQPLREFFNSAFFRRFVPYFTASTQSLSRQFEYAADAAEARLTDPETAARVLIKLAIIDEYMSRHVWPAVYRRAANEELPPAELYTELHETLERGMDQQEAQFAMQRALLRPTAPGEGHPALADRLAALGFRTPQECERVLEHQDKTVAARMLLNQDARARYEKIFSRRWKAGVISYWREQRENALAARDDLQKLEQAALERELTVDELWKQALLHWNHFTKEDCTSPLEAMLSKAADDPRAHYLIGLLLLHHNDEAGVAHLERALKAKSDYALPALEAMHGFYWRHGRREEALHCVRRIEEQEAVLERSKQEQLHVSASDTFLPHDLTDDEVNALIVVARKHERIVRLFAARKVITSQPDKRYHIIGVELRIKITEEGEPVRGYILRQLCGELVGDYYIVMFSIYNRSLQARIEASGNSIVYESARKPDS